MRKSPARKQFAVMLLLAACWSSNATAQPQKPAPKRELKDAATVAPSSPGRYYALVIGNNNYVRTNVHKLETPINDAVAIEAILKTSYGFKTELLRDASRDQILTALVNYRRTLRPDANLLIYYAGHGILDRDAGEAYWVPVDGDGDNSMNWISADEITRAVRAIPAKHVLVISDSCYSGAILADDGPTRDLGRGITPTDYSVYLSRLQTLKSRSWMASGSKEPVADNGAPGHSIFAAAVLQGLAQMKENQFAAGDLFYAFVRRKVAGSGPQLPQYGSIRGSGDDLGDFIFSHGGAPAPETPDVTPVIEIPATPADGTGKNEDISRKNPARDDDKNRINDVLHQYELAYNTKSAAALWKIWPGAPIERRQPIESYFKSAQSIRTVLQMGSPEISADQMTAIVRGRNHVSYVPKAGPTPPASDGDITFTLKRDSDAGWVIVNVEVHIN